MATPVLVAVEDGDRGGHAVERELRRRYEPDYEVISAGSAQAGLAALTRLADAGRQVVVILVDLWTPGITGTEFLTRARQLHPAARRCLLLSWGDQSSRAHSCAQAVHQSARLGEIDDYLPKPVEARNEHFHRAIAEYLDEWALANAGGFEVVKVVGHERSPRSYELCDLLTRNAILYGFYAADSPEGQALLEQAAATSAALPLVVVFDGQVLENPTNSMIAEALGVGTRPAAAHYDIAVLGAGPAGLAAAVYGGSEGLAAALLEPDTLGGQASASPRIRNYLGFSHGVSGADLTRRAFRQASQFGVDFIYGTRAVGLRASGAEQVVTLSDGSELRGSAVIIATGCSYRRLGIPALEALIGAGVFYGPAVWEAQAMKGRGVFVVGGANSAGQTAVHLASCGARVTVLSRGSSFAQTMSTYLIKEIQSSPAITVRHNVVFVVGGGRGGLVSVIL
jgi:thioredoxin reductase (NADPH)